MAGKLAAPVEEHRWINSMFYPGLHFSTLTATHNCLGCAVLDVVGLRAAFEGRRASTHNWRMTMYGP